MNMPNRHDFIFKDDEEMVYAPCCESEEYHPLISYKDALITDEMTTKERSNIALKVLVEQNVFEEVAGQTRADAKAWLEDTLSALTGFVEQGKEHLDHLLPLIKSEICNKETTEGMTTRAESMCSDLFVFNIIIEAIESELERNQARKA